MDLSKLTNIHYLFSPYPDLGFSWLMRIVLLLIFLGAIALALLSARQNKKALGPIKKVWKKWQIWGWTTGVIGLFLIFFREVNAIYLSSRGYLLIWLLTAAIWAMFIIIYWKRKVPAKKKLIQEQEEFNKWLPKARRR